MTELLIQDAIATAVAAGAAAIILRRTFTFLRPAKNEVACSCGTPGKRCAASTATATAAQGAAPLIQITRPGGAPHRQSSPAA